MDTRKCHKGIVQTSHLKVSVLQREVNRKGDQHESTEVGYNQIRDW